MSSLKSSIERLAARGEVERNPDARQTFFEFRDQLTQGKIRAAEKIDGRWMVNIWVKQGILLGFRLGELADMSAGLSFVDKDTFPARRFTVADRVRVVPGGSTIREGAYVAPSVICMPPMFINVGAYIDEGTMVDSHALVGSCAQIGKRVHISAASQIGGVLEPAGALPVIIEDVVFDLVRDQVYRRTPEHPLEIPAGAVVVPGTRPVRQGVGAREGIALYAPV